MLLVACNTRVAPPSKRDGPPRNAGRSYLSPSAGAAQNRLASVREGNNGRPRYLGGTAMMIVSNGWCGKESH